MCDLTAEMIVRKKISDTLNAGAIPAFAILMAMAIIYLR